MQEVFSLDAQGGLSAAFQQAIRERGVWWDGYLVLDRTSLVEVIELTGGVDLEEGWLSGVQMTSLLETATPNPRAQIGLQAMVIQQFCQSGKYMFQNIDPKILASLILDSAVSDFSIEDFSTGWVTLQDSQGGLTCELLSGQIP